MRKRAQLQMSFGFIFTVIIIAVTLAVAGYIIIHFINIDKNIECKLYYDSLQKEINDAWASDGSVSNIFNQGNDVPAKTEKVCFGSVNQTTREDKDKATLSAIRNFVSNSMNLIFYPKASCGQSQFAFTLKHVKIEGFFCVDVRSGKAEVRYVKGVTDPLVKLCPLTGDCAIGDSVVSDTVVVTGIIAGDPVIGANRTDINICRRASNESLCDDLESIFDDELYKDKCCLEHRVCC